MPEFVALKSRLALNSQSSFGLQGLGLQLCPLCMSWHNVALAAGAPQCGALFNPSLSPWQCLPTSLLTSRKIVPPAPGELIYQGILTSALRSVRRCVVCADGVPVGRGLQHKQQLSCDSAP